MTDFGSFPAPPAPPIAPQPRSTRNWPLIAGTGLAAVLLVITGGVLIIKASKPHNQLRALDRPIDHPERVLRRAELYLDGLEDNPRVGASDLVIADDAACWFSYADGKKEPNNQGNADDHAVASVQRGRAVHHRLPGREDRDPAGVQEAGLNSFSASGRLSSCTPGSLATASSHAGRTAPTAATATSRPDSVAAWRANVVA
jgi:hypothetical protein